MRRLARGLVTLLVFGLISRSYKLLQSVRIIAELRAWSAYAASGLVTAVQVAIAVVALRLTHRLGTVGALRELGLVASPTPAILFGLAATSPMFISFALSSSLNPELSLMGILFGSLIWPLAEEILYRGYAFRQLFARAKWGFWPAALSVAAVFGLGHLYQVVTGNLSLLGAIGVFCITALGSVFFSWLFVRWSYNLWVPFCAHAMMNLWWDVFAVDQTALGGWLANAARLATVLLAVFVTLRLTRAPREGERQAAAPAGDTPHSCLCEAVA